MRNRPQVLLIPLVFVVFVGSWEWVVRAWNIPEFLVPAPSTVAGALARGVRSGLYVANFWVTLSYFSCEADEPLLPQAIAYVGADRIMYASDCPHWDHSYPKSVKELADRTDVSDEDKRKVLAANARKFYKV